MTAALEENKYLNFSSARWIRFSACFSLISNSLQVALCLFIHTLRSDFVEFHKTLSIYKLSNFKNNEPYFSNLTGILTQPIRPMQIGIIN